MLCECALAAGVLCRKGILDTRTGSSVMSIMKASDLKNKYSVKIKAADEHKEAGSSFDMMANMIISWTQRVCSTWSTPSAVRSERNKRGHLLFVHVGDEVLLALELECQLLGSYIAQSSLL